MIYCTPAANPLSQHTDCRFSPASTIPQEAGLFASDCAS
jgi:hypothetical protein